MKNYGLVHGLALTVVFTTRLFAISIDLGSAGNFAAINLKECTFDIKGSSSIYGNVGVAAKADLDFSDGGRVNGAIYGGQNATIKFSDGSTASGGTVLPYSSMPQVVLDANQAADYYAGLAPLRTFDDLDASTIQGNGGVNVFKVKNDLKLSGKSERLIITGGSSDLFVFNIYGDLVLSDHAAIVLQGLRPDQVLFNLIGDGTKLETDGDSSTQGIFLAKDGGIDITGGTHQSAFLAGDDLKLDDLSLNDAQAQSVPDASPYYFGTFGLVWALMIAAGRRRCSSGWRL